MFQLQIIVMDKVVDDTNIIKISVLAIFNMTWEFFSNYEAVLCFSKMLLDADISFRLKGKHTKQTFSAWFSKN